MAGCGAGAMAAEVSVDDVDGVLDILFSFLVVFKSRPKRRSDSNGQHPRSKRGGLPIVLLLCESRVDSRPSLICSVCMTYSTYNFAFINFFDNLFLTSSASLAYVKLLIGAWKMVKFHRARMKSLLAICARHIFIFCDKFSMLTLELFTFILVVISVCRIMIF